MSIGVNLWTNVSNGHKIKHETVEKLKVRGANVD